MLTCAGQFSTAGIFPWPAGWPVWPLCGICTLADRRLQKISNCKPRRRGATASRSLAARASRPCASNLATHRTCTVPCCSAALAAALPAHAQVELDPVVVTAERTRQTTFDAPAAISAVTRDVIDNGGPQVNLSEALNRVPGITVLNRQNYAQDLQLSIRGFGSRSTFGIRGVRLIVDGIPATMPDGQGQASNIALGSAQRIEVLRGPLAQLYGNAAGGVVQVFTEHRRDGAHAHRSAPRPARTARPRFGVKFGQHGERDERHARRLALPHRRLPRPQRGASATQLNAQVAARDRRRHARQRGRQRARPAALAGPARPDARAVGGRPEAGRRRWRSAQDARKMVRQQQIGTVIEHRLERRDTTLTGAPLLRRARPRQRAVDRRSAPQQRAHLGRRHRAVRAQLLRAWACSSRTEVTLDDGRALRLTGGVEYDRMSEDRQGYINNAGVQGALKRDERNTVDNRDVFVQAASTCEPQLHRDRRRAREQGALPQRGPLHRPPGNPDDSGGVDYSATNPVLGLTWRATPDAQRLRERRPRLRDADLHRAVLPRRSAPG